MQHCSIAIHLRKKQMLDPSQSTRKTVSWHIVLPSLVFSAITIKHAKVEHYSYLVYIIFGGIISRIRTFLKKIPLVRSWEASPFWVCNEQPSHMNNHRTHPCAKSTLFVEDGRDAHERDGTCDGPPSSCSSDGYRLSHG